MMWVMDSLHWESFGSDISYVKRVRALEKDHAVYKFSFHSGTFSTVIICRYLLLMITCLLLPTFYKSVTLIDADCACCWITRVNVCR